MNSGYRVYDPSEKEIYPCLDVPAVPLKVRVKVSNLPIRKGPGTTYDYHKQAGKAVYTGEGIFTIVKTSDGPGAELWGLLKSYSAQEDGWIPLDKEYVEM